MRVARFLLRRARAQLGTLLTLLVLAATVAAILAGTIGYTRAAGVSTVRSTLVEAPAREAGIQVQTRLADDPDAQDAAVRATLTRLLGPDLAVSRGLWTEPLGAPAGQEELRVVQDRKSTRLNSSHVAIPYAVFCLKKKKQGTPTY